MELDHIGFANDDIPTVLAAIVGSDVSVFRAIPERMQQGFLNFMMAMRTLSREADAGPSTPLNQALTNDCGGATIDGSKRYYFGGSQGGILGASIMALNLDIERGMLAVPGQSYNLLLNRSVNFDEYSGQIYENYGWNALDLQMILALIQGLWDRAEPTGYSKYIRTNRLPGTPAHEVLIQVSKADHQVTNLGAHIMARTIGGVVNLAETIRDVWGIEVVSGEHQGSAMIEDRLRQPGPADHQHSALGRRPMERPPRTRNRARGDRRDTSHLLRNRHSRKPLHRPPATKTTSRGHAPPPETPFFQALATRTAKTRDADAATAAGAGTRTGVDGGFSRCGL